MEKKKTLIENFNKLKKEIINKLNRGNIIICGLPQHGKSYFSGWLINEINLTNPETNIIINDEAQVLQYILGKDFKVYVAREKDNDSSINLLTEKRCIIDTSLVSPNKSSEFIKDFLVTKYQIAKIEKNKSPNHICTPFISLIDEAGDIWDSYSLRSNKTPYKKIFAQCGNYNMHFIFTTNRLASLSTEIVERCQGYIFFKLVADNDIRKLSNILKGLDRIERNKVINAVQNLDLKEAVYWDGVKAIGFKVPNFNLGESTEEIKESVKRIWNITQDKSFFTSHAYLKGVETLTKIGNIKEIKTNG